MSASTDAPAGRGQTDDRPLPGVAGRLVAVLPRPHLHRARLGLALVVLRMPQEVLMSILDVLFIVCAAVFLAAMESAKEADA